MLWFNHPAYKWASSFVLATLAAKRARLKRLRPIIFLCGANKSARRDRLADYLRRHNPDLLIFYAEEVFQALVKGEPAAIALELEGELAELADAIVVIAESPGTFAELGAFAISDELRQKLLPIADRNYEAAESFLRTGPIRWADRDSRFGPTIWTDFSTILDAADDVSRRLASIGKPTSKEVRKVNIRTSRRHLLFVLILVIEIFGPVSEQALQGFLQQIVGPIDRRDLLSLLGLGDALKLIGMITFQGEALWFRSIGSGRLGQMVRVTQFAIATMRARILSAMQAIPSASRALDFLADRQANAA